jgi:hypothetical protein
MKDIHVVENLRGGQKNEDGEQDILTGEGYPIDPRAKDERSNNDHRAEQMLYERDRWPFSRYHHHTPALQGLALPVEGTESRRWIAHGCVAP